MARAFRKSITGRRERQQQRRLRTAELFAAGRTRAEVAAELLVSWRAAHTWRQQWQADGTKGLEAGNRPGPAPKFSDGQVEELRVQLVMGSMAHGYSNELWTLRRIARLIMERFHLKASASEVWRLLKRMGWSPQKPQRKARERDEEKINQWKTERRPELRAKAGVEERTVIFLDECGFSQKKAAKKTWAPGGQTPVLEMNFNRDKLSVIGGISLKSIRFQIHEESVKSARVIEFLNQLKRHVQGDLMVIWDGPPARRSRVAAQYLAEQKGRIWVERLPACAPELNPIEDLWGNVKGNDLANFSPKELRELSTAARAALHKKRRRPNLIRAFWVQTEPALTEAA